MTSPLEGSLAKTIGKAMRWLFLPASLTRDTPTSGPDAWTPSTPTRTVYACRAIHEDWGASLIAGGLVKSDERKVLILAASLAVTPAPGDRISIRGAAFTIVPNDGGRPAVSSDPALAVWQCRAKA